MRREVELSGATITLWKISLQICPSPFVWAGVVCTVLWACRGRVTCTQLLTGLCSSISILSVCLSFLTLFPPFSHRFTTFFCHLFLTLQQSVSASTFFRCLLIFFGSTYPPPSVFALTVHLQRLSHKVKYVHSLTHTTIAYRRKRKE